MKTSQLKKDWSATPESFARLLEWLDAGENSDGQTYLEMRRRLVAYFDRKNARSPDDLADETLNRVARRVTEEAGAIDAETPAKYCYITARFVFLESLRAAERSSVALDDEINKIAAPERRAEIETRERMLECLEKCAVKLEAGERELIFGYYFGAERVKIENRRALARKFGISANALTIRACRIRARLESCVRRCCAAER
jgi:DNA-directed RNA polymerase specialized sigma24 family protein